MDIIKNVKIFTGFVEQDQLQRDMQALKASLGGLRSVFRSRGIRLRTEQCDSEDLQEIKEAVAGSDVCIFLFMTEMAGQTRAQFDCAYERMTSDDEDTPSILVWFRESDDVPMSEELSAFRGELRQDIGHFINRYNDIDTVQFQLLLHLEREGAGVPFVWVGTKLLDARGNVIMDFAGTAAYAGNEKLQAVRKRLAEYEARQQELLDRELDGELSDDELDELDEVSDRIAQETEEESKLQERFLSDMRQFVSELADDKQMSPRRRKAIQLISIGRVREGYNLLDTREIERDTRAHEARAKVAAAEAQGERGWVLDGVKQLLLHVQMLRTFVEEQGAVKDEEIRQSCAVAMEFEERNGFEPLAAVGYGEYLVELGVYDKAMDLLDGACAWYRRAIDRSRDAQYGIYVAPDPFMPSLDGLQRGLARALDLLTRAEMVSDASSSAAYAASERIDILRGMLQAGELGYGSVDFAEDLVAAARVMEAADRPDDALEYLEQACDLLEEASEADEDDMYAHLHGALAARRDLLTKLGHSAEASAMGGKLIEVLRHMHRSLGSASSCALLTKELRTRAHDAVGAGNVGAARELTQEALSVERRQYEKDPSTPSALALSKGCRISSVLAAKMRDSEAWSAYSAQRLHALVVEYRRMPTATLQKEMGQVANKLLERWLPRSQGSSAELLLPEFVAVADALEGIQAPGEDIFLAGRVTGDALMGAVAMMEVVGSQESDGERLLTARLERLRADSAEDRGLGIYSVAFESIAEHLRQQGRVPFAYGLTSERLCALRIACGLETTGDRSYARTSEDVARLRVLIRALGYAAQYAREHGRLVEGNALLEERLGLLRESFRVVGGLPEAYALNKALIESSERWLARGNLASMTQVLEEAWDNACMLHAIQESDATLRNLLYVGKRVDHRFREAGQAERAEATMRSCLGYLSEYYESHGEPEVGAYVAHVTWMYVVELRESGEGHSPLVQEVMASYERMTSRLAASDSSEYLRYLKRYLNNMVDGSLDDEARRSVIDLSMSVAEAAYHGREAAGEVQPDDLRTLSSVYELGVLVAFGHGFDDQAETYVSRCIELYEGRYERALSQDGGEGAALSVEECANQLSKQLARLAKDMRRFGHPDRADELGARSTRLLADLHEANPRSRGAFVYSSQLHNDSLRLIKEGDVDEGMRLRRMSVEVLDRYRQADPTERNLLWYTRSLKDLAHAYREFGQPDEADATEVRMLGVFAERYESDHTLLLLTRYLYSMSLMANRLQKEGEDDRALPLYRKCEDLALEAFRHSPSVESARLLGRMQVYLYKQLSKLKLRDEAREVTSREVVTQRYLFEHGRTASGAKVFATVLYNEGRRLRWLSRNQGRKDYFQKAMELHAERVEVLRWLSHRDMEVAQRLADELTKEITIVDPRDPLILRSMRRVADGGHNYPFHIGAERALVCQEALMCLYREDPSTELEDRLCDMKGVRVQFLLPRRRVERSGEPESEEARMARMRQAADELYELVPLLEDRYARTTDEANAYRLAHYLKLASVVFEEIGRQEDALGALERRVKLLQGQLEKSENVTTAIKYAYALNAQAQLLVRMDRQDEALRIDDKRETVCRKALEQEALDENDRERIELELLECLKHRETLLYAQGADMLSQRTENLEAYTSLLRKRVEASIRGAEDDEPGDHVSPDEADGDVLGAERGKSEPRDDGDACSPWAFPLAVNLGRLASCRKGLGEAATAISAYGEAIRLLRQLGERVSSESMASRVDSMIRCNLGERAVLLAEQLGTNAAANDAGDPSRREMVVEAALAEALGHGQEADDPTPEEALLKARLHQLRYQLFRSRGELEEALADAEGWMTCLDAAGEESVDPIERASAIAELGKTLAECGRAEEAELARERKTEGLRRAYSRRPDTALGLYLGIDLAQRVSTYGSTGQRDKAVNLTLERLELLGSIAPGDASQLKGWRLQLKNTIKRLIAFAQADDDSIAAQDALERAEGYLARRAETERDHLAASSHLDLMASIITNGHSDAVGLPYRLELLGRYGHQVLAYAYADVLEPGIFDYHGRNAARLFTDEGAVEDATYMLEALKDVLSAQWKSGHDGLVGDELYKLHADLLEGDADAATRLNLLVSQLHLSQELRARGLRTISDRRIYRLYEQIVGCANEAGEPLDGVMAGLALVDRDYDLSEQEDAMLEPLADSISGSLRVMAGVLKGQRCGREAFRLEYEARNCGKNLGKPGWNWWRQGYKNVGRPWRSESELGAAQRRLQRASHVLRLSLELGDWYEKREDYRNLRNLFQLRYEAYRRGQDAKEQIKKLVRLKWCMLNASTTLYKHRDEAEGMLAESVVLRIEMLEVMYDIAQLKTGGSQARQAKQEYVKALRMVATQMEGDAYNGLGYADVRTWVVEHIAEVQEELNHDRARHQ